MRNTDEIIKTIEKKIENVCALSFDKQIMISHLQAIIKTYRRINAIGYTNRYKDAELELFLQKQEAKLLSNSIFEKKCQDSTASMSVKGISICAFRERTTKKIETSICSERFTNFHHIREIMGKDGNRGYITGKTNSIYICQYYDNTEQFYAYFGNQLLSYSPTYQIRVFGVDSDGLIVDCPYSMKTLRNFINFRGKEY